MNRFLLVTALLLLFGLRPCAQEDARPRTLSASPDAGHILQASFLKCSQIQAGSFVIQSEFKNPSFKDTMRAMVAYALKRAPGDSVCPFLFHSRLLSNGKPAEIALYTGNEFIMFHSRDSSGDLASKDQWAAYISSLHITQYIYGPFTDPDGYPMSHAPGWKTQYIIAREADDTLDGIACYRIRVNDLYKEDTAWKRKYLKLQCDYWISKVDSMPLQYTVHYDDVMDHDTTYDFERHRLKTYDIHGPVDDRQFSTASVPSYYRMVTHTAHKRAPLLSADTLAPAWTLSSVQGEKISLGDLKGKVVLVDFFYKACDYCMLALPKLEALHEKYKDKGLAVIGIDPFDSKDNDMAGFLSRRGVTYPVLLDDVNVAGNAANAYRISGFPTVYLIDPRGKVISSSVGYGPDSGPALDAEVESALRTLP